MKRCVFDRKKLSASNESKCCVSKKKYISDFWLSISFSFYSLHFLYSDFRASPSLLLPTCVSSPSFLPSTCVALQKFCLECKYFDFMYLVLCKLFVVDGVICKFCLSISENLKWDFDSIFYVWVNESMSIFYEWMSQVSVNKVRLLAVREVGVNTD